MPRISGTPNQSTTNVNITGVTTSDIQNVTIAVANTEQSIVLPANTKRFRVCVRGSAKLQIAYTATESGTNYISVWPGAFYEETGLDIANLTLYVQASASGEIVEVVSWS